MHRHEDAKMSAMMRRQWLLCAALILCGGCSYLTPLTVSTTHLDPEHEIPLGIVSGTAVNNYFLGISGGKEEGMQTAIKRAKLEVGADNLINISVDRRVTYYPFTLLPLIVQVETIVYGTGVRYIDRSWNKIKDYTAPESPAPAPAAPPAPKPPALKPEGVF